VVDPSLLRLAADRGVTICFADLDGADGLWVPEERTVLVNRRLSEREVAEVIEHELGHVAIDDQHADLDAGVGRPPPASSRRWAAALTAAACLAVVGGVTAGLTRGSEGGIDEGPVVAPSAPPLTAAPPGPGDTVTRVVGPDGRVLVRTVTLTASASGTTPATTTGGVTPTGTQARPVPPPQPSATSPVTTTSPPTDTTSPTPDPTTPDPKPTETTPAAEDEDGVEDAATSVGGTASTAAPGTTP
jgi:hypothetical protein